MAIICTLEININTKIYILMIIIIDEMSEVSFEEHEKIKFVYN